MNHTAVRKTAEDDFEGFRFGIAVEAKIGKKFAEAIPAAIPLAVVLVFVDEKCLLQSVQGGRDLLDEQSAFLFQLPDGVRAGHFDAL